MIKGLIKSVATMLVGVFAINSAIVSYGAVQSVNTYPFTNGNPPDLLYATMTYDAFINPITCNKAVVAIDTESEWADDGLQVESFYNFIDAFSFVYSGLGDGGENRQVTVSLYPPDALFPNMPKVSPITTYTISLPSTSSPRFAMVKINAIEVPERLWISFQYEDTKNPFNIYYQFLGFTLTCDGYPNVGNTYEYFYKRNSSNGNWSEEQVFTGGDFSMLVRFHVRECIRDINRDGLTNTSDLSIMLSNWNQSVPFMEGGDLNGDSLVNNADLSLYLTPGGCTPKPNN